MAAITYYFPIGGDPAPPIVNSAGTALRVDKQFDPQTNFAIFGASITVTLSYEGKIGAAPLPGGLAVWASVLNNDNSGTGALLIELDLPTLGTGGNFILYTSTVTIANPGGLKYVPLTSFAGEQGEELGFESVEMQYQNVTLTISDPLPPPPTVGNTGKANFLVVPASDAVWAGGLNRVATVTEVADATHFTYRTADYDYKRAYTEARPGAIVTPSRAEAAPAGIPGPFSFDTKTGLALTGTEETIDQDLNEGQGYSSFALDTGVDPDPALQFPDEPGYLVFAFGFENVVGPVKYLGRLSGSELLLDASFKFPSTVLTGSKVSLLSSKSPFVPSPDELTGNFYATDSAAGRVAAQRTIDQITAAGLPINVDVLYPGDRGLGGEGLPDGGVSKITDAFEVWGGNELDKEIAEAKKGSS